MNKSKSPRIKGAEYI